MGLIMKVKSARFSWFVASDLKRTKKFFTETLGMKLHTDDEQFKWIELGSESEASCFGVAEYDEKCLMKPGQNAIITLSVDNIEEAREELLKKGVKIIGEIEEVPGHVKMQTFTDPDGNLFQLIEILGK